MMRPAESGRGFTKTDPAFWPPGWFSRRQRTISSMTASPSPGSPRRQPERRVQHDVGVAERGSAERQLQRGGGHLLILAARRGRTRGPSASVCATSPPWPPAFMRTAPPTEPGTPTAHSRPVSPAAALRRASTGRLTAEPARTSVPSISIVAHQGPRLTAMPGKPRSATSRFEPRPTTSTGSPLASRSSPRPLATHRSTRPRRTARPRRRPDRWSSARAAPRGEREPPSAFSAASIAIDGFHRPASVRARRHDLVGQRRDVAAAHRNAEVAAPQPRGDERRELGSAREVREGGGRVGVEHGVDDELAGDPGDRAPRPTDRCRSAPRRRHRRTHRGTRPT